ncbi:DNA polymerase thumb domain-containing protein [Gottfriedia solisilvae]|uniref:Y-family DNA polymerase n=1 Tax=Gottfriedia solisilvae TaxID=1516104 RepID=UPI003D2EB56A
MYDYSKYPDRLIFCVDLKSFYASVSCVELGLDPLQSMLAVVGDVNREGSIVLAATPLLKQKFGISTQSRKFNLPVRKDVHVVNPSMRKYVQVSNQITELMLTKYVAPVDLFTYSIDEFFMDFTAYSRIHNKQPYELAKAIQNDIYALTGVNSTVGIGSNMLLSKLALDNQSKKSPDGIAEWKYEDVQTKVWAIEPLDKFWGIASKTQAKLNRLGITNIGQLAQYPVEVLIRQFGQVMGNELHLHSNGIDFTKVSEMKDYRPTEKSIGKSQVLLRDFQANELNVLLLEMLEEVCFRMRGQNVQCRTIQFSLGYSSGIGGFNKSLTIEQGNDLTMHWYKVVLKILKENYENEPVRTISISFKNFVKKENSEQISFFSNPIKKQKETNLTKAMDSIRKRYGRNSILRACSYLEHSTMRSNNKKIGGHLA